MIGAGKITVDQHIPAVLADAAFRLVGAVSPVDRIAGVAHYSDLMDLFADAEFDAVAVNTPPRVRFARACQAIAAGKHVLLEKPPCATLAELNELVRRAEAAGVTLYTGWHSQHAPGVPTAREWLASRRVERVRLRWCENVRQWHPGQRWIWEPGGLGVFDPGINALSILTAILPCALTIESAELEIPGNCQTPIAASLIGRIGDDGTFEATLDFLQTGLQTWSIDIAASGETLSLSMGGAQLAINGVPRDVGASQEYSSLYARFGELIGQGRSEIDVRPLTLAADAFLVGRRTTVDDFIE